MKIFYLLKIAIMLPYLLVDKSYTFISMEIPYTEKLYNYEKYIVNSQYINNLFESVFPIKNVNFKITSNKLLNINYLNSANRPNSYTITIEYQWN